jgi:hypothetical protein
MQRVDLPATDANQQPGIADFDHNQTFTRP